MAPAWGPVLGGALTSAATAYLESLLEKPYEAEKLEKARLQNEEIRVRNALNRAHAEYYGRGQTTRSRRPIVIRRPDNSVELLDPETLETLHSLPAMQAPAKPLNPQQQFDKSQLDEIERLTGHGPPWTDAELDQPTVAKHVDLLRRYPRIIVSGPGEYTTAEDIRAGRAGRGGMPPEPPAAPPPTAQREPEPRTGKLAQPHPAWLKYFRDRFRQIPVDKADKEYLETLRIGDLDASKVAAMASAYQEQYKKLPPATREAGPETTTPQTPAVQPETQPPPGREPGTVPTVQTATQQEEARRKREDQAMEKRRVELAEAERTLQQNKFDRQKLLDSVGGQPTDDMQRITRRLYLDKDPDVQDPDFLKISQVGRDKVMQRIRNTQIRKEERAWRPLAQPYFQEDQALDTVQRLVTQVIPLVHPSNLGFRSLINRAYRTVKSQFFISDFEKRAVAELQKQGAPITEAAIAMKKVADVETNDPKVREFMRNIGTSGRIDTIGGVLMYAHAMANKRIVGGTERGIINIDMEEAKKFFDPNRLFANPDDLLGALQELQKVINDSRQNIRQHIRDYHFDPDTHKYIPGEVEDLPETPGATPAPTTRENRLRNLGDRFPGAQEPGVR